MNAIMLCAVLIVGCDQISYPVGYPIYDYGYPYMVA